MKHITIKDILEFSKEAVGLLLLLATLGFYFAESNTKETSKGLLEPRHEVKISDKASEDAKVIASKYNELVKQFEIVKEAHNERWLIDEIINTPRNFFFIWICGLLIVLINFFLFLFRNDEWLTMPFSQLREAIASRSH